MRLVSNQLFDGGQHAVLVVAAEPAPQKASHAGGAVIGMAWLTHSDKGWTLDLGSPDITIAGASGKAPDASIIDGGMWVKGVVLQHADMHQGEAERQWQLFVPDRKSGAFVSAVNILTLRETSNACHVSPATAACLKDDFSTNLNVVAEKSGLAVVVTVSYPAILNMRSEIKTYHVTPDNLNDSLQQPATVKFTVDRAAIASQPATGPQRSGSHGSLEGNYNTPEARACTGAIEGQVNRVIGDKYDTSIVRTRMANIVFYGVQVTPGVFGGHKFQNLVYYADTFDNGRIVNRTSPSSIFCVLDDANNVMGLETKQQYNPVR